MTIVDDMHLVHQVRREQNTFGEIASTILSMALNDGLGSQRVDIVFDSYWDISIKNTEHKRRGNNPSPKLKDITPAQIVRRWRSFLSNTENKANLIAILVREWQKPEFTICLKNKLLHVTVEDKCFMMTNSGSHEVPSLQSIQDEAVSRLLLHAVHAAQDRFSSIKITSEDTDVLVLCLHFQDQIQASSSKSLVLNTDTDSLTFRKLPKKLGQRSVQVLLECMPSLAVIL